MHKSIIPYDEKKMIIPYDQSHGSPGKLTYGIGNISIGESIWAPWKQISDRLFYKVNSWLTRAPWGGTNRRRLKFKPWQIEIWQFIRPREMHSLCSIDYGP